MKKGKQDSGKKITKKENFFNKNRGAVIMQTVMCVLNYAPPILCPLCKKTPTIPTWNSKHRYKLPLRACPKCEKVFTPEPKLKLIKGLSIVRDGKKQITD